MTSCEKEIEGLYNHAHELVEFSDSNEFDMVEEIHCAMGIMSNRITELERDLKAAMETIEDVCIGTQLECTICHKWKPCMCDK